MLADQLGKILRAAAQQGLIPPRTTVANLERSLTDPGAEEGPRLRDALCRDFEQLPALLRLGLGKGVIPARMTVRQMARRLSIREPSAKDPFWTLMCGSCGTVGTRQRDDTLACGNPSCEVRDPWPLPHMRR
jgi:hypothetical protein